MGQPGMDRTRSFLYEGQTLDEWMPALVERVAKRFDPVKIIVFGSVARGEANYDSASERSVASLGAFLSSTLLHVTYRPTTQTLARVGSAPASPA